MGKYFTVDEAVDVVSLRESFDFAAFMLQNSSVKTVCHSGVQGERSACHDIDVVFVSLQLQIPIRLLPLRVSRSGQALPVKFILAG